MRKALRWAGRIGGGLLTLVLVVAAGVFAYSQRALHHVYDVRAHALAVRPDPTSAAMVATGERLSKARGCRDCHGANLGGQVMIDDPAFGRLASANLTSGGAERSDADWERAVRHGVRKDGTPLLLMPSKEFNGFSDEEIAALIAYARSVPAVRHALPAPRLGPIARGLFTLGKLPIFPAARIDHARPHPASVTAEMTPAFGAYLAAGCTGCHGDTFNGGAVPGGPPGEVAANITPDPKTGIGAWSEDDFVRALRTAVRPNGTAIDTTKMPVPMTRAMTDVELRALYRYLRTLPPRPKGKA